MKLNKSTGNILTSQRGFTLIELIMVIVIIGILAVVAIPKYADMKTQAAVAQADGVYAAAQGAASINFAAGLVGATQPAGGVIDSPTDLLNAMGGAPDGWAGFSSNIIRANINDTMYNITITAYETATAKLVLTKSW